MSDPTVQEELIARVRESGFLQKDLAAVSGMSEKHVSQMLTGKVMGSLEAWQKLLRASTELARRRMLEGEKGGES